MPFFSFSDIAIRGIATAVPSERVDIKSYASTFGEAAVDKFIKSTGVKFVHRASENQTASDLGISAARELIRRKELDVSTIGAMYFVTQSPDYRRPSSASVLHGQLGLPMDCAAMEINLGCSGFVYGLEAICASMACSDIDRALLILGETASKLTNPKDKSTTMLYGDSGAAILLEKEAGAPSINILLKSDGSRYRAIVLPAGGFRDFNAPHDEFKCGDGNMRSLYDIYMDGMAVFTFTISDVPEAITEYLDHFGRSVSDYDTVVLHQANSFILNQLSRKFRIPPDKLPKCIDRYGNTGGISIPLTICDAFGGECGRTLRALMSGFGVGLSWGVAEAEINVSEVFPVISTDYWYLGGRVTKEELIKNE